MYIIYRYKIDPLASEKHTLHFIQIMLHLYNFVTDHSIQSPFGIYVKPNMYLEYQNVFRGNFIPYESYQYWNIVNIFLIAFMFKLYIIVFILVLWADILSQNQISVFSVKTNIYTTRLHNIFVD